jgi:transposase
MYCDVAQWRHIRRLVLEKGKPKKQVSRETGIGRRTINKMLKYENPPGYGPRPSHLSKLLPFIPMIDQLLSEGASLPPRASLTIRDIVDRLRREEGFSGSYDLARRYIRRLGRDDASACERAYDLIIRLPKANALDFIRLLSWGRPPIPTSAQLRPFVRQVAYPRKPSTRPNLKRQRRTDIEWMRQVLQRKINGEALERELGDIPGFSVLLKHLYDGRLPDRNRAMVVLASQRKISSQTICGFLGVGKAFVRKYRNKFNRSGAATLFARKTKSNQKINNDDLRRSVFSLLHEPPANHGINRTSWTMPLLCRVLKESGTQVGVATVRKLIKDAGYRWRKAKVVLTSNDPHYTEKLALIRSILSNLQPDEVFFSIDEYGPFSIKMKAGRTLAPPGVQPVVPQWQKSRGCLIMTAALELSGNQITHFYSAKKNTGEMIRMMEVLIDKYRKHRKLYLSWDAASWHMSKQLYARIDAHNAAIANTGGPVIETAPLPASAQFLNVIESVFSGMARAIIHNSDYKSVDEAKAAIDRHFSERNSHFVGHPRRAGKKIWGKERVPAAFSEANNCKDPKYR